MGTKIPKMLASAKRQACIICGADDGTIVACHYTGFRQHMFGKGTGTKCSDLFTAHFCAKCHNTFDSNEVSDYEDRYMRKIDQSEQFMVGILKTWERLYQQGKIKIT